MLKDFFSFHSSEHKFQMFSITHIVFWILMLVVVYLIYKFQDKIRSWKYEFYLRLSIGLFMLIMEFLLYIWHFNGRTPFIKVVPFELCGFLIYLLPIALIFKVEKLYRIIFFWYFGTILALISTSGIDHWIDRFRFYSYMVNHAFILFAICYGYWILGYIPNYKDTIKSNIIIVCIAIIAVVLNYNIGSNFLYLLIHLLMLLYHFQIVINRYISSALCYLVQP